MTEKGTPKRTAMNIEALQAKRNSRMKSRRKLLGLTQSYVTALIPDSSDANRHLVGRIESGDVGMTDIRAVHIAQILRVPLAWLYGIEEWADVPPEKDPYLDAELMYEQILGSRQIARMTAEINGNDHEARTEILNILVRNEIKKKGVNHGQSTKIKTNRTSTIKAR